jgi:hypothetical protein
VFDHQGLAASHGCGLPCALAAAAAAADARRSCCRVRPTSVLSCAAPFNPCARACLLPCQLAPQAQRQGPQPAAAAAPQPAV